jgi:hypothetical protein
LEVAMVNVPWLSDAQWMVIEPFMPTKQLGAIVFFFFWC